MKILHKAKEMRCSPWALLTLLFPAFVYFFNGHDFVLPNSDGAHYVSIAVHQYNVFIEKGFWEGVKNLYFYRSLGQRPLLYPVFITIVLKLCNGDLYVAKQYVQSLLALFWSIYTYRIIRLYAEPLKAACGSFLIVGWPGFFFYHFNMFSEVCHVSLLFAMTYHLLKSNYFEDKKEVIKAGIFGALMLCVRPELLFIVPLGLVYLGYKYFSKNNNFWCEVGLNSAVLSIFFLSLISGYVRVTAPEKHLIFWVGIFATLALLASTCFALVKNCQDWKKKTNIFLFTSIMLSISLLWYFLYPDDLYKWFMVGYYNLQDYNNPVAPFSANFPLIYDTWKGLFWFLVILSLIAVYSIRKSKVSLSQILEKHGQPLIIGSIVFGIYLILFLSKSAGITPVRRISPGANLLMLGLLIFTSCAQKSSYRRIINLSLVVATCAIFINLLYSFANVWNSQLLVKYQHFMEKEFEVAWHHQAYDGPPKPEYTFISSLTEVVKKHKIENGVIRAVQFTDWRPDVTLGMDIAQAIIKPPYEVVLWNLLNYPELKTPDQMRKSGATHVVIDTFPEMSNENLKDKIGFAYFVGPDLLYKIRNGDNQGMKLVDKFEANGRTYLFYSLNNK